MASMGSLCLGNEELRSKRGALPRPSPFSRGLEIHCTTVPLKSALVLLEGTNQQTGGGAVWGPDPVVTVKSLGLPKSDSLLREPSKPD